MPSFRSQLSETFWSIIWWFDPLEKGAKQAPPKLPLNCSYQLFRSQHSDMSWHSRHILFCFIESFFDEFLLAEQRWNANLSQSWKPFWNPMSQFFKGVCQVCLITELVKIVVSLFRIFSLGLRKSKFILLMFIKRKISDLDCLWE